MHNALSLMDWIAQHASQMTDQDSKKQKNHPKPDLKKSWLQNWAPISRDGRFQINWDEWECKWIAFFRYDRPPIAGLGKFV